MSDLAATRPRIARLIALLGTDNDGECLAAARALGRTLAVVGADFHDLAASLKVAQSHPVPRADVPSAPTMLSDVLAMSNLSPWERRFCSDLARASGCGRDLTKGQLEKLIEIYTQRCAV